MDKVIVVIIKNLIVNVFLVLTKILSGIFFHSSALVADGVHSLSDLITDFASLFGEEAAKLKKGKKKIIFEDETSVVIGIIIIVLAVFMIVQAFHAEESVPSTLVIFVSVFVIIAKTLVVRYVARMGKKLNNSILLSSAEESKADIISSIIALIAILLSQLSTYVEILKYSDIVGGAVIGLITLFVGLDIIFNNEKSIKKLEKK